MVKVVLVMLVLPFAGDFNQDGYDDILSLEYRVLIIKLFVEEGENGFALNCIGDINGDGYDDIAINGGQNNSATGAVVYVIYGSNDYQGKRKQLKMATSLGIVIYGANVADNFLVIR
jgi:hypothetical protein